MQQGKKANTGTVKCKALRKGKKKTGAEVFRSFPEVKVEIKQRKGKLCRAAFKAYASNSKVLSARCTLSNKSESTHYTEWDLYSVIYMHINYGIITSVAD